MVEGPIKIVNPLGLHARAAGQLVKLAAPFDCRIVLRKQDNSAEADAKSMLDVLTLAAPMATVLTLETDGREEKKAFDAVRDLFASGFGEI